MPESATARIPIRAAFALFFLALTMAAVMRPLSRARFNFAPDYTSTQRGVTRHTYLEVGAALPELPAPHHCLLANDPPPMPQARALRFEQVTVRQLDNWPIAFVRTFRRIPASRSSDPDPAV